MIFAYIIGNALAASVQPLFIQIEGLVGGVGVMASSASVGRTFSITGKVL